MGLQPLTLADAELALDKQWLGWEEADELLTTLFQTIPWENHRIRLFGRVQATPRLSCWIGDADAVYRYSGSIFEPRPWPPALMRLRRKLSEELGVGFNSVLANLYRDGADSMGWHSDDEPELGPRPAIASVSLGASRRFLIKHRHRDSRLVIELTHGSLLLMAGDTQQNYRHSLPATAKPTERRINLTFRSIGTEQ